MHSLGFLRPIRNVLRIFSKERSPQQIALAVALGVWIGLLPKGNLLALALTVLMFAIRVNLGWGLTTAFLVSLAQPVTAPLTHEFGIRALRTGWVYQTLEWLYQQPIVPWTSLNNSVVVGSCLLGLVLFYPTYHVSRGVATQLQTRWQNWRQRRAEAASPALTE